MDTSFVLQGLLGVSGTLLGAVLWKLSPYLLAPFRSSLLNLPGPPSPGWLLGNLNQIYESEGDLITDEWIEKYGPNIMYRGVFNGPRLYTTDTRALNHIVTHSAYYQKPEQVRRSLAHILGKGVLFTEGDQHRQQRRVMNPAFGPAQIRELTDIFVTKSIELRDLWISAINTQGEVARVDVLKDLSKMTLDVIGLAGFGYEFDSLNPNGKPNELAQAFQDVFNVSDKMPVLMILRGFFPVLRAIPDKQSRRIDDSQAVMRRIGMQLVQEKKAEIMRERAQKNEKDPAFDGIERRDLRSRDLLTLLIKANMATDIPDSQRLSDEDVLAQVPTFLVAGHETTSTATTWCLFALTQSPDVQKKLRDELLTIETENPTMDELNALPYLDMVVHETLRLYAPVPTTMRVATKDDIIPVGTPFTDRNGEVQDSIKINGGESIIVPIATLNRLRSIWGEDSYEFKPERWEHPPEVISNIPGVWGHIFTFLGGPRACIGYRFSLVEMKALLFTLVRAFEFELAVPPSDIIRRSTIVTRPLLRSALEEGTQMPINLKLYKRD
ncbi:cytochrome P450 [Dichomitus squalens LYAD-421 SS1]|uniref:Cytochrome P450 n=1 Tax=Dichomitus squalens (strain LYAD-421) TaxID=732165 RepID=R7SJA2_DICSQ|nr:cytochrome P450 [Dichomitus squalens LYAD-421 SS1]EJF55963.1 cytochrome P450 [Dichomitus squalens LYAD-421 SS1]